MIKNIAEFKQIINEINKIANDVFEELGPGFDENDYQVALQLEFSKSNNFESLREISVELFYKDQYLKFGELDFLISPKKKNGNYPLPFFVETKVVNSESPDPYDQIRRYLMSLPKNNSALVNQIQIAALLVFVKNSEIQKGEIIEKDGNKIIKREPSKIIIPKTRFYINCYYYDHKNKTIKLIENLFD
tara:strand:- start:161 stop:727 length:567 start_codon:yes stop_codon:yes gene_type:complete